MQGFKITIGVCAMAKKAQSKPMKEILQRLEDVGFVIIIFEERAIIEDPIEDWPLCDCMIAFFSAGFPLAKAEAYSDLRKPFVVNDLHLQWTLMDRIKMYTLLREHGVPTPKHVVFDHKNPELIFVNCDDHVECLGSKLKKPVVEKPQDGDDHNVRIYWPSSSGGGCTRLFRKIDNRSSEYVADLNEVRTDGVYIYEEFVNTHGVDVKVYTCGPDYAHAEARKAPAMDGRVMRNERGKEERYPVILTEAEKMIARTVVLAFKQNICGLDLLRSKNGSVVCDVNGWSFVKDSVKYWDDTAQSLSVVCLNAIAKLRAGQSHASLDNIFERQSPATSAPNSPLPSMDARVRNGAKEKLLCVSIVARHADRTPKQKMKLITRHPSLLTFCDVKDGEEEVKMKQTADLQKLLTAAKLVLKESDSLSPEEILKLHQLEQVLEMSPLEGMSFYRKVQLKPKKVENGAVVQMVLILKWGGKLTWSGKTQAMDLGHALRVRLYPSRDCGDTGVAGGSLLRLHATYRHDLKIYTSDEGRVILSAAAFAKGLLDLEGFLPPIASMMLQSDEAATKMLDIMPQEGRVQMDAVKTDLSNVLHGKTAEVAAHLNDETFKARLAQLGSSPDERMKELHEQLTSLVAELSERQGKDICPTVVPHLNHASSDPVERIEFVHARWRKLQDEFFDAKRNCYDISKLPDIYDCSLYDMLHNAPLQLNCLPKLHEMAHALANFMVPLEYGISPSQKRSIGIAITKYLVRKLYGDLHKEVDEEDQAKFQLDHSAVNTADVRNVDRRVHTRLYFTSESHIISLLNFIRWGHVRDDETNSEPLLSPEAAAEFDSISANGMAFLTHLVLTVHESTEYPADSIDRFRIRILYSPGANNRELKVVDAVPLTPKDGLPLSTVATFFSDALLSEMTYDPSTELSRLGSDGVGSSQNLCGSNDLGGCPLSAIEASALRDKNGSPILQNDESFHPLSRTNKLSQESSLHQLKATGLCVRLDKEAESSSAPFRETSLQLQRSGSMQLRGGSKKPQVPLDGGPIESKE